MNALPKLLITLTAAAAFCAAYPAKANLVQNGGFETATFADWTLSGDTTSVFVVGSVFGIDPHSGSFQAALGNPNPGFLSQMLALVVGTTYTVDFWLANNLGGTNSFAASLGGVTGFSLTNGGASGYTGHTFNFTFTGGSTELLFTSTNVNGSWLLDDVSVKPTGAGVPDSGSTVSLLGCSLLRSEEHTSELQ